MSKTFSIVQDSVRSNGRDTIATNKTGFLNAEAVAPSGPEPEPTYELWTEERNAQSRARRENRENRTKPTPVAEVSDFDLESHIREQEKEKQKEKSKWKLFK